METMSQKAPWLRKPPTTLCKILSQRISPRPTILKEEVNNEGIFASGGLESYTKENGR